MQEPHLTYSPVLVRAWWESVRHNRDISLFPLFQLLPLFQPLPRRKLHRAMHLKHIVLDAQGDKGVVPQHLNIFLEVHGAVIFFMLGRNKLLGDPLSIEETY